MKCISRHAIEKDNIFLIAKRSVQTDENRKEQETVRSSRRSTLDLSRSDKNEFLLNLQFRIRPFLSWEQQTITWEPSSTQAASRRLFWAVSYIEQRVRGRTIASIRMPFRRKFNLNPPAKTAFPTRSQFCRKLRRGRTATVGDLRAGVKLASSPFIELADGCAF